MSYLNWHVGMKVVCITSPERISALHARAPRSIYPTSGGIYTVREIRDDCQWRRGEHHIVLLLSEIDNSHMVGEYISPSQYCYVEPGFNIRGFKPVEERKTDISIFTRMLNPQKQDVEA